MLTTLTACGLAKPHLRAHMKPLPLQTPKPLKTNVFKGDKTPIISELDIARVLDAPVFLEDRARIGVVPVATGYKIDKDLPVTHVPGELSDALEGSRLFEVTTEVSTDWPAGSGIPGLRELASRYRCEYLLLYRHRFVDRDWVNGWGAMSLTILGTFFVPMNTLETAGVLEATLFDVRSGTLLFTIYERVHARTDENVWQNDRKRRELKERLLSKAALKLADQVVAKTRLLAAARPDPQASPKATTDSGVVERRPADLARRPGPAPSQNLPTDRPTSESPGQPTGPESPSSQPGT